MPSRKIWIGPYSAALSSSRCIWPKVRLTVRIATAVEVDSPVPSSDSSARLSILLDLNENYTLVLRDKWVVKKWGAGEVFSESFTFWIGPNLSLYMKTIRTRFSANSCIQIIKFQKFHSISDGYYSHETHRILHKNILLVAEKRWSTKVPPWDWCWMTYKKW